MAQVPKEMTNVKRDDVKGTEFIRELSFTAQTRKPTNTEKRQKAGNVKKCGPNTQTHAHTTTDFE